MFKASQMNIFITFLNYIQCVIYSTIENYNWQTTIILHELGFQKNLIV